MECQYCHKCISTCPVKAIRVKNDHADIIQKLCVLCGNCIKSCPIGARHIRSDVENVKKLIGKGGRVIASLAPSFASEFYNIKTVQLIAALKKLGFYAVSETAIGADLISRDIAKDIKNSQNTGQKLFLSSACSAVVLYIKRYAPSFIPYLNDRASPLLAHALLLKKLYGKDTSIVFIGPCAAKKREADQMKEINAALTFEEIYQWFDEENIIPEEIKCADDEDFIPFRAAKGALSPVDGGMFTGVNNYLKNDGIENVSFLNFSGINNVTELLKGKIDTLNFQFPLFVQMFACQGGCINGDCAAHSSNTIIRTEKLLSYARNTDDYLKDETVFETLKLTGTITAKEFPPVKYSGHEIRVALASIEKFSEEDHINCSMCGYDNCISFAKALIDKRAEKTMCAAYLRSMARRKANALINTTPSGIVIVDKDLNIIECNRNFARLLGKEEEELFDLANQFKGIKLGKFIDFTDYFEEALEGSTSDSFNHDIRVDKKILHLTTYVIEKGEVVAGTLDDITRPTSLRRNTVLRARKIIEKNVVAVQKIAFLLGENAAETEAILNSIIESHTVEEPKK
jgi:iron only hydrogenase large subunit-like protein